MAVKKAASRKRTTTTRAKSTRTTTKRATKAKSRATVEHVEQVEHGEGVEQVEAVEHPERAEAVATIDVPAAPRPAAVAPTRRSALRDDQRPSRFTGDYYLHATNPKSADAAPRRPGKWMIFVSRSRIDALWESVRRAVESGRLGYAAKVSTALPSPLSPDPKKHVVCVYTPDEDDAADVRRVREVLRALGVTWKIPYKSDKTTRDGQHEVTTRGPAAKYYE
jgi:hypothetical protein